ncbi:MAG: ThiF family adenylyltransferase [Syntrophorhabdaceae bacterium]|nr:ThiF family adenylyltransferase [Syntrophorhabdaceae bacterium]
MKTTVNIPNSDSNRKIEISVFDARRLIKEDPRVTVIDVRERGASLGHIPGALFIPFEALEERVDMLPAKKDTPILIYCGSGIISAGAVTILRKLGYTDVHSITGGFNAWQVQGFEIASDGRLTVEELNRYSRNILLEEIGVEGQLKLLAAKVLIVGAGGLGSPAALYLAAAGIGTLGIADFDILEVSNLNRQIIHTTEDVGRLKTDSAKDGIKRLNPDINVITYNERLTAKNALEIAKKYDVIMDATDNIRTKFLLNDVAFFAGKPYVFGGAVRFEGQAGVFFPRGGGPCLRCLFPKEPQERLVPT